MEELDDIRRRKLTEMIQHAQDRDAQDDAELRFQQQIAALESAVKQRLTKDALQRYGTIKVAHPEKAMQLIIVISKLMESNPGYQVSDNELKEILLRLQAPKTRIIRK